MTLVVALIALSSAVLVTSSGLQDTPISPRNDESTMPLGPQLPREWLPEKFIWGSTDIKQKDASFPHVSKSLDFDIAEVNSLQGPPLGSNVKSTVRKIFEISALRRKRQTSRFRKVSLPPVPLRMFSDESEHGLRRKSGPISYSRSHPKEIPRIEGGYDESHTSRNPPNEFSRTRTNKRGPPVDDTPLGSNREFHKSLNYGRSNDRNSDSGSEAENYVPQRFPQMQQQGSWNSKNYNSYSPKTSDFDYDRTSTGTYRSQYDSNKQSSSTSNRRDSYDHSNQDNKYNGDQNKDYNGEGSYKTGEGLVPPVPLPSDKFYGHELDPYERAFLFPQSKSTFPNERVDLRRFSDPLPDSYDSRSEGENQKGDYNPVTGDNYNSGNTELYAPRQDSRYPRPPTGPVNNGVSYNTNPYSVPNELPRRKEGNYDNARYYEKRSNDKIYGTSRPEERYYDGERPKDKTYGTSRPEQRHYEGETSPRQHNDDIRANMDRRSTNSFYNTDRTKDTYRQDYLPPPERYERSEDRYYENASPSSRYYDNKPYRRPYNTRRPENSFYEQRGHEDQYNGRPSERYEGSRDHYPQSSSHSPRTKNFYYKPSKPGLRDGDRYNDRYYKKPAYENDYTNNHRFSSNSDFENSGHDYRSDFSRPKKGRPVYPSPDSDYSDQYEIYRNRNESRRRPYYDPYLDSNSNSYPPQSGSSFRYPARKYSNQAREDNDYQTFPDYNDRNSPNYVSTYENGPGGRPYSTETVYNNKYRPSQSEKEPNYGNNYSSSYSSSPRRQQGSESPYQVRPYTSSATDYEPYKGGQFSNSYRGPPRRQSDQGSSGQDNNGGQAYGRVTESRDQEPAYPELLYRDSYKARQTTDSYRFLNPPYSRNSPQGYGIRPYESYRHSKETNGVTETDYHPAEVHSFTKPQHKGVGEDEGDVPRDKRQVSTAAQTRLQNRVNQSPTPNLRLYGDVDPRTIGAAFGSSADNGYQDARATPYQPPSNLGGRIPFGQAPNQQTPGPYSVYPQQPEGLTQRIRNGGTQQYFPQNDYRGEQQILPSPNLNYPRPPQLLPPELTSGSGYRNTVPTAGGFLGNRQASFYNSGPQTYPRPEYRVNPAESTYDRFPPSRPAINTYEPPIQTRPEYRPPPTYSPQLLGDPFSRDQGVSLQTPYANQPPQQNYPVTSSSQGLPERILVPYVRMHPNQKFARERQVGLPFRDASESQFLVAGKPFPMEGDYPIPTSNQYNGHNNPSKYTQQYASPPVRNPYTSYLAPEYQDPSSQLQGYPSSQYPAEPSGVYDTADNFPYLTSAPQSSSYGSDGPTGSRLPLTFAQTRQNKYKGLAPGVDNANYQNTQLVDSSKQDQIPPPKSRVSFSRFEDNKNSYSPTPDQAEKPNFGQYSPNREPGPQGRFPRGSSRTSAQKDIRAPRVGQTDVSPTSAFIEPLSSMFKRDSSGNLHIHLYIPRKR
ncbi:adhesive plaque matrix protein [Aplysia californica]|uniref:Adhesive plaque matrix protein n=1 Tax=Aplysia californica TaxID=6500 RepID=A0ABM0K2I7_APLCA|nr:adhesive plaque matrix protein [Aplysia californica]